MAGGTLVDHLDAGRVENRDQPDQRIDIAPHHDFTRLHALNDWRGKARQPGELALADAEKHPRSPQLRRCDHGSPRDPNPLNTPGCIIISDVKVSITDI